MTTISRLTLSLSLSLGFFSSSSWCALDPLARIKNLGLEPMSQSPIEFSLKDLQNQEHRLSQYKGQWVWLVFWATWCPVCVGEMPTLESLYQEFKNDGLIVLGVSVDQDKTALEAYVKKNQLSFPILHDAKNEVAGRYQASGVPSLYLISPDQKMVGLARGALNWERKEILSQVKELLPIKTISQQATPNPSGQVALPHDLAPPHLTFIAPKKNISPKRWLPFEVLVSWPGNSNQYSIKVPQVTVPEGVEVGKISTSSSNISGSSTVKYHYPLKFKNTGRYRLGPVDLIYRPRKGQASSEQTTRDPGLDFELPQQELPWMLIVGLGAFLVLGTGVGFGIVFVRKKTRAHINEELPLKKWDEQYQSARKIRLEGSSREYGLQLIKVCQEIQNRHPEIGEREHDLDFLTRMADQIEKIEYAGHQLDESELRRMEKIIEWGISGRKEMI